MSNLNNNFALMMKAMGRQPNQRNNKIKKPINNKKNVDLDTCKFCFTKGKLVPTSDEDDSVCTNCGRLQGRPIMFNQEPGQGNRQNNGKVRYARVIVEENQKIRLLTNNFFREMFPLLNESRAGNDVAAVYQELKRYKARYISKSNIQSAFKGLHMPTIVLCILYCKLIQENRAVPLSIMAVIMNKTISRSRTQITPVDLKHIQYYRINKKIGISKFFKLKQTKCYNTELKPNNFIDFTCNMYGINSAKKRDIAKLSDEIYKEYSDMTPPGLIATGVMYHMFNKIGEINAKEFGKTKKELTDIGKAIEKSKNKKIQDILKTF